jgi:hypothetical protein
MSLFRSEPLAVSAFALAIVWQPLSVAFVDLVIPIRLKLKRRHKKGVGLTEAAGHSSDDFTILVPIFGHIRYLKNADFLAHYGEKVVLCTTNRESQEFNEALEAIAVLHGFRIFRSEASKAAAPGRPNPWKLLSRTLDARAANQITAGAARDEIIRDSFARVHTTHTIFLDGDTVANQPLSILAGAAATQGFDVASVRVLAWHTRSLAEKLQAIEYEAAMNSRRVYPWLTSGACLIGKTRVLQAIMHHHSLFFSGGDIEIGKLAKMLKYSVGHIPFDLYTDVPETLSAWFKQRMAWCGGGFRHAIVNSHRYSWRHPFYYLYTTIIVYLLTPMRWYELVTHPKVLLFVIPLYWVLTVSISWGRLHWWLVLHPIYCLVQVMIIVPLGAYTYCKMARHSRNLGHIRFRPRHQTTAPRRLRTIPQLQTQASR